MGTLEPKNLTLNGLEFSIGRLDLFDALNVSRIVAPILPVLLSETLGALVQAMDKSKSVDDASEADRISELARLIVLCEPVFKSIASMPRADFESVVKTCLSACEIRVGKSWSRVVQNGQMMFDNIDQTTALILCVQVIWRELNPIVAALNLSPNEV